MVNNLNQALGVILTVLIIAGIGVNIIHWLIDVRSRLSATEASVTAIRDWIKAHEDLVARQQEMFNQMRIEQATLMTKVDDILEQLRRLLAERIGKWEK